MRKSPDAFRTISEVAQDLDLPQHVLRFWETRFSQIKPMKRGGGRRYYRPDDIDLLKGIRHLLYDEGYTIKGVQRILKEQGVRFVIDTIAETEDIAQQVSDGAPASETDLPQQDYSEPNQLELTRPPLVAPRASAPLAPHANASAVPTHPSPTPPPAGRVSAQASAAPMQTAAGAYAAPETTAASHVAEASPAPAVNQPAPTIQSIQSAQAVSLPVHGDATPSQAAPQPTSGFAPQPQSQLNHAPSNLNNQAAPSAPEIAVAPSAQAANWQEHAPVQAPQMPKANATHAMQEPQQAAPMPRDLSGGDPKFLSGESASISVSDAERGLGEQSSGTGLFNRLRGRVDDAAKSEKAKSGMARDDIRRLQSTLFELLECKRILDHARSDGARD